MTTLEKVLAITLIVVTVAAIFRMAWMAQRTATIDHWRVQARRMSDILEARLNDTNAANETLTLENERLRKCVSYYAHASTWAAPERHKHSAAAKDRGEIARGALEAGQ